MLGGRSVVIANTVSQSSFSSNARTRLLTSQCVCIASKNAHRNRERERARARELFISVWWKQVEKGKDGSQAGRDNDGARR